MKWNIILTDQNLVISTNWRFNNVFDLNAWLKIYVSSSYLIFIYPRKKITSIIQNISPCVKAPFKPQSNFNPEIQLGR